MNGSRKVFGTDGIRGIANVFPMTPEMALRVGKAVAHVFKKTQTSGKPRIVIGKDTRLSGYMLESALTAGILSMGVDVLLVGPVPTPALGHMAKSMNCAAGIMLTASHNPAEDNGIKIFDGDGFKLSDDMELRIEEYLNREEFHADHIMADLIGKATRIEDARGRYIAFAKFSINNRSLVGLKIVLDVANGAGYYIAPEIFKELGAELIILNNSPDGLNINKECGAQYPERLMKTVVENHADIGIALDGDGDRVIICDEKGREVNGDKIMVLLAKDMLGRSKLKKDTLVVTDYSNMFVDEELGKLGGKVVRVENGDRYVIEEMGKSGYNLGGEFSGHIILGDFVTSGDAIITSLAVLDVMIREKKKVSELIAHLNPYPQVIKSIQVKQKKPFEEMPKVQRVMAEAKEELNGEGRTLFRYSGTECKCRLMLEGKDKAKLGRLAKIILDALQEEIGV